MIYDQLPVYKASYDLILMFFALSRHMQRDYRYTLGENIKTELIALMVCIYNANSHEDKEVHIGKAREHLVVIKLQIRLLVDLKQISIKQYATASELVESISKQLAAWHKYAGRKDI